MSLADSALREIVDSVAFQASAAPYLLLDTELRIQAANPAYEQATLHRTFAMAGRVMFEVFPDNPEAPEARGVERLGASFERALATGAPDRMGLQRYDVHDAAAGAFVAKSWLPVNRPVRDADGRIVGVLHHVEDVSHLLLDTALERHLAESRAPDGPGRGEAFGSRVERLRQDATVRRLKADSLVGRSERALARMRRLVAVHEGDEPTAPVRPSPGEGRGAGLERRRPRGDP